MGMTKLRLFLSLISLLSLLNLVPAYATAAPTGLTFDHIIIIAMENTNYADLNSSSTPFILSLEQFGSNMTNFILNQNMEVVVLGAIRPSLLDSRL